jgi:hypothetical protein
MNRDVVIIVKECLWNLLQYSPRGKKNKKKTQDIKQIISSVFCWPWVKTSIRRQAILNEVFIIFLSTSKKMPRIYLKLRHDSFLPRSFKFIFLTLYKHSTLHNLSS